MSNLKFYAKTTAAALLRWLFIAGVGLILAIIGIYIAMHLIGNNTGSGYAGARTGSLIGVIFTFLSLFNTEFWSALLLAMSVAFVFIYAMVASKISLGFVISSLYEHKLAGIISEKITHTIRTLTQKPGWAQTVDSASALKAKLYNATKEDNTFNKIQHKVIQYAIKKIKLDDINFKHDNANLPEDISSRVMEQLSEAAKPSYLLFWIAISLHAVLVVLAFYFDHT